MDYGVVITMSINQPLPLSEQTIRNALKEFGVEVSHVQVSQIQQYMKILLAWNEKLNLTAIRDPLDIMYRHFCESMYAGVSTPMEEGRLADVGSGAGFPGLPLKILRPNLHVFLIESNVKKATFLAEVIRGLELADTRVLVSRYEELGEEVAPLDFVCSRAVGDFRVLLEWADSKQVVARQVVLWIGARDLEAIRRIKTWDWRNPIPVPHSMQRILLVGRKRGLGVPE
jgi:16S rRNA (guanine527-N7)-methyltransferase